MSHCDGSGHLLSTSIEITRWLNGHLKQSIIKPLENILLTSAIDLHTVLFSIIAFKNLPDTGWISKRKPSLIKMGLCKIINCD